MAHYKLYYFPGRGRAELSRLIFAAAGQEYEDIRMTGPEWIAHKPNTPFGQMPALEVHEDGKVFKLAQSIAIARFLARRFNLAGANETEQAEVDMYGDQVTDLLTEMVKHHFEKDEAKKAEIEQKLINETVPHHFKLFETKLNESKGPYLFGNKLTWADLFLVTVVEWLGDKKQSAIDHFPALKKQDETVRNVPNIAKWLQSRPDTSF